MITFFSSPKPFQDSHIATIQRNAITTWTLLKPKPEIILMGDEEGVGEVAGALGLRHERAVERNIFGTPLLSDVFELAQENASGNMMCYVNTDVLLFDDFPSAIERIMEWRHSLIIGGRLELDFGEAIDFDQDGWDAALKARAHEDGQLSRAGMDYFVFPKGLFREVPPFALGRPAFDNWLVWSARSRHVPVVDVTKAVTVVHQNHRAPGEWQRLLDSPESEKNRRLCGSWQQSFTVRDASHELSQERVRRRRALALGNRFRVITNMTRAKGRSLARAALRRGRQ